jgi:predicted regulator of Ras-like GTPase activity (Roadblock/LC7/MglB family)
MNKDLHVVALKEMLTEIKKVCPDITSSFIFTKDGTLVAGDPETDGKTIEKITSSFQNVAAKTDFLKSLTALHVNGKKRKVILSSVKDMYLAFVANESADTFHLQSITRVITSTILNLLETVTPTPLQLTSSKQLVVDTLSGFFVGDSVQIDTKVLQEWTEHLNQENINQVEIEAFGGESMQCKVKEINDPKLKDKGMIRIPEKICKTLDLQKGELVKVTPASD